MRPNPLAPFPRREGGTGGVGEADCPPVFGGSRWGDGGEGGAGGVGEADCPPVFGGSRQAVAEEGVPWPPGLAARSIPADYRPPTVNAALSSHLTPIVPPSRAGKGARGLGPSYTELHCHSCYSLRDGASTPDQIVRRAKELGYHALALTDHDGFYGAVEFTRAADEHGIRPIIGAEITLTGGFHLTLLVETANGYANICRMLSHAYLDHGKDTPEVTFDVLRRHTKGLIALSGCRKSEIAALAQAGHTTEAEEVACRYRDWFGPRNFFIELQHNLVYGDTARVAALALIATRIGVGYVATNDVHYHVRERHRLHDVLVAIRHRTTLDASHQLRRANSEFYLKSPAQMARRFARYPEALRNTLVIAERCQFHLIRDLGYRFPDYPVPPGETHDTHLAQLCNQALERKYPTDAAEARRKAEERLSEELRLIRKHNLAGFFLTYYSVLELASQIAHELHGRDPRLLPDEYPIGRGRGSSVSSIVCYLIGLSHIDPIKNDLFLGRFLNDDLTSIPDIDLDFPRDIREKLLERIYYTFGQERAALVCSFATYQTRSAVRDVGKALGLPAPEIDKLAKHCDHWGYDRLREEMGRLPEFKGRLDAPLWRDLVALTEQLIGLPRHISQHVGGVVLSARSLREIVPIEPARMDGRFVCQWDKDSIDDVRFVKIDFLALGMLSLVHECLNTIEVRTGQRIDLGRIPHDDPRIFDQICAGDTIGLFQIESRAQIQTLPQTQPRTIDDLAVEVAIVRPGPIVGGAFHPYMEQRRRQRDGENVAVDYPHPSLEPVLKETLGVILYQEQVLQVAMALAGFTAGQAESLRRSMSRKRSHEAMESHWPSFRAGALNRGVSEDVARAVFDRLLGFASYGFPKSHAVAFALLSYESAWLRHHFPTEYYCALLNNQPMGFYSVEVLTGDARRHGVRIVRPDVNLSAALCRVETDGIIRLGFASVKGISERTAAQILSERGGGDSASSAYQSLFDFAQRTKLAFAQIENLIAIGAFDSFGLTRRELLWQLGLFYRPADRQPSLPLPTDRDMVPLSRYTAWEELMADYALLDLSPRWHPLALLRRQIGPSVLTSRTIEGTIDGATVRVAGMVVCRQRPGTAKGVVFLLLEDEYGLINVVVYPRLFERDGALIRREPFLYVTGRVQRRHGTINVVAFHFEPLRPRARMNVPTSHDFR